jgi:acid stress chaperone HdeA
MEPAILSAHSAKPEGVGISISSISSPEGGGTQHYLENAMKRLIVAIATVASLSLSSLAFAQAPKPVTPAQMSCSDFLAVQDAYKPALVYWISGVDKLGVRETITNVVDVATPVAAVVSECQKTPAAPLAGKVHDLYKKGQIALFKPA